MPLTRECIRNMLIHRNGTADVKGAFKQKLSLVVELIRECSPIFRQEHSLGVKTAIFLIIIPYRV